MLTRWLFLAIFFSHAFFPLKGFSSCSVAISEQARFVHRFWANDAFGDVTLPRTRESYFNRTFFRRRGVSQVVTIGERAFTIRTWRRPDNFRELSVNGVEFLLYDNSPAPRGVFVAINPEERLGEPMEVRLITNAYSSFPFLIEEPVEFVRGEGVSWQQAHRFADEITRRTNAVIRIDYPQSRRTYFFAVEY